MQGEWHFRNVISEISVNIDSKRHCIARRAQSLLDLRLHYVYTMCLTGGVGILNQVKHGVLEITYHWIGPEDAFSVWTLEFLLENLGSKI